MVRTAERWSICQSPSVVSQSVRSELRRSNENQVRSPRFPCNVKAVDETAPDDVTSTKSAKHRLPALLESVDGDIESDGEDADDEPRSTWGPMVARPFWANEEDEPPRGADRSLVLHRESSNRRRSTLERDLWAEADVPRRIPPGYRRDGRGSWRYAETGERVPGARDVTLDSLYDFERTNDQYVLVPRVATKVAEELAWCEDQAVDAEAWNSDAEVCFAVPVMEWQKRARVPIGLDAPELLPTHLWSVACIAELRSVTQSTVMAEYARRTENGHPEAVGRWGNSPMFSAPIYRRWLRSRRGQHWRKGQSGSIRSERSS